MQQPRHNSATGTAYVRDTITAPFPLVFLRFASLLSPPPTPPSSLPLLRLEEVGPPYRRNAQTLPSSNPITPSAERRACASHTPSRPSPAPAQRYKIKRQVAPARSETRVRWKRRAAAAATKQQRWRRARRIQRAAGVSEGSRQAELNVLLFFAFSNYRGSSIHSPTQGSCGSCWNQLVSCIHCELMHGRGGNMHLP